MLSGHGKSRPSGKGDVDMKKLAVISFALALLGAGEPLSTDRYVHGVITSVDASAVTITDTQRAIIGKLDASRTRVTINGKAAKIADLKVTAHAKAELCLDDVWVSIDAH
jgi:hypothetical protein